MIGLLFVKTLDFKNYFLYACPLLSVLVTRIINFS